MSMQQGWQVMRSMSRDSSVKEQTLAEGTTKRVMSYARPYRGRIAAFLVLVVIDAVLVVATPLILKSLVDDGVVPGDRQVVVRLAVLVAGLALLTAARRRGPWSPGWGRTSSARSRPSRRSCPTP